MLPHANDDPTLICGTCQGHYVMRVKENQPGPCAQAESHPGDLMTVGDHHANASHGRLVRRELKIVTLTGVLASTGPLRRSDWLARPTSPKPIALLLGHRK